MIVLPPKARLVQLRKQLELTQSEFARLVTASPGQVHDWENGRRKLTLEAAAKIERATNASGLVECVVHERTAA